MANLPLILTDVGKAALAAAQLAGTPFPIDLLKVGTGQYTPTGAETDIISSFAPTKEFANPAGSVLGATFQYVFADASVNIYNIGEIGLFSGSTLFAISSQPAVDGWLLAKGAARLVVPSVYKFESVSTDQITFNVANTHPLSVENLAGLISIAANSDVDGETDDTKALTTLKGKRLILRQSADQNEYDNDFPVSKFVSVGLDILATKLKGVLSRDRLPDGSKTGKGAWEGATQTEYNDGVNARVVTTDLYIPANRIEGLLPLGITPSTVPVGASTLWWEDVAPAGWAILNGQNLSRSDNPALFALWGSKYGSGDGVTTFGIPNLSRRVPVGAGGVGTSILGNEVGDIGGEEQNTLDVNQMPTHNHPQSSHAHTLPTHLHTQVSHTHTHTGHSHSLPGHNHGIGNHAHPVPIHGHTQPPHNHTQSAHTHDISGEHNHALSTHSHGQPTHRHSMELPENIMDIGQGEPGSIAFSQYRMVGPLGIYTSESGGDSTDVGGGGNTGSKTLETDSGDKIIGLTSPIANDSPAGYTGISGGDTDENGIDDSGESTPSINEASPLINLGGGGNTGSVEESIGNVGGGLPYNNMQPSIVCYHIVKLG